MPDRNIAVGAYTFLLPEFCERAAVHDSERGGRRLECALAEIAFFFNVEPPRPGGRDQYLDFLRQRFPSAEATEEDVDVGAVGTPSGCLWRRRIATAMGAAGNGVDHAEGHVTEVFGDLLTFEILAFDPIAPDRLERLRMLVHAMVFGALMRRGMDLHR
jgi:hypothetical protein